MRSTSNLLLATIVLAFSCSVSCVEFDYADGIYECTLGEADNCPSDWECRWSAADNEYRCFEDSIAAGSCSGVASTCTGCCTGPDFTGDCLAGTDVSACGGDGLQCQICVQGETCDVVDGAGTCVADPCAADGATECNGECVDIQSDQAHCGQCNKSCDASVPFCVGGECTSQCTGTMIECGGTCVDPNSDPYNCSDCGIACDEWQICDGGECACPEGLTECFGLCVDLATDATYCGACDNPCPDGASCVSGGCQCPVGWSECPSGSGGECVYTDRDPNNCGSCGSTCAMDEQCVGGNCTCRPGLNLCSNSCVDYGSDPSYCGDCTATICDGVTPWCLDGNCSADCGPTLSTCNTGPGDFCVDLSSHPLHCGSCGDPCNSNEVCTGGNCITYYPTNDCSACSAGDLCCSYPDATALICVIGAPDCPGFGI